MGSIIKMVTTTKSHSIGVSLPVQNFEGISLLHRIANIFCPAPHFLLKVIHERDKNKRFIAILSILIDQFKFNQTELKPFHPILGETLTASINT